MADSTDNKPKKTKKRFEVKNGDPIEAIQNSSKPTTSEKNSKNLDYQMPNSQISSDKPTPNTSTSSVTNNQTDNKSPIFVLDTNILMFLGGRNYFDINLLKNLKSFFAKYKKDVYIFDLVWNEFCGVFFQKNIDFNDYNRWYRDQHSFVEKTLRRVMDFEANRVNLSDDKLFYSELSNQADKLSFNKLDLDLIKEMLELQAQKIKSNLRKAEKTIDEKEKEIFKNRIKKAKEDQKVFDGLDSLIVAYAVLFSKSKKRKIFILTDDLSLMTAINFYHKKSYGCQPETIYHDFKNVEAITLRDLQKYLIPFIKR